MNKTPYIPGKPFLVTATSGTGSHPAIPSLKELREDTATMMKELREADADRLRTSICDGLFICRPAGEWIERAMNRPDPVELWMTLWHEHEISCLFADSNMGKSIYAVQIADHIARTGRKVLYFDFELADKQFQLRYTDQESGRRYNFSPNLMRIEFGAAKIPGTMAEMVERIEQAALSTGSKILIIDNLTWICNNSESGDAAGELMQLLVTLKRKIDLSILCLAHTPKRAESSPLTQNSLAGSKRIANFMDSMFAIGKDLTNQPSGRYVKQIKVRSAECLYGSGNVIRYELTKENDMLFMKQTGFGREDDLLQAMDNDRATRDKKILELSAIGKTQRDIAIELNISKGTVSKVLSKHPY